MINEVGDTLTKNKSWKQQFSSKCLNVHLNSRLSCTWAGKTSPQYLRLFPQYASSSQVPPQHLLQHLLPTYIFQEYNTAAATRARTQTARSEVQCTSHTMSLIHLNNTVYIKRNCKRQFYPTMPYICCIWSFLQSRSLVSSPPCPCQICRRTKERSCWTFLCWQKRRWNSKLKASAPLVRPWQGRVLVLNRYKTK